jgi:exopolysaccharide biosynthesis polyprenyl glycosylphosphotransferase
LLRSVSYVLVRRNRRQRRHSRRALIVGAGEVGEQLARNLHTHADYGLLPVGMVDDDPWVASRPDGHGAGTPVLGGHCDLVRLILEHDVHTVIFAFTSARESDLVDLIRSADKVDCEMYLVPRLFEFNTLARSDDFIWGLPVAKLARPAFHSPTRWLKRLLDVTMSAAALVALSPVMAVCALLVRLETGGIIFRQQRIGVDGRPFDVLKFQSLAPRDETEAQTRWNVADDDRLGPIGRFLRSASLDELPQLWNVLVGDMSLVGPRPERPHFVREFSRTFPRYSARSRVAAGLTGWAQIHSLRGDTSIAERASFDNYYIEHWSAWGDVKILLRTLPAVLFRHGR